MVVLDKDRLFRIEKEGDLLEVANQVKALIGLEHLDDDNVLNIFIQDRNTRPTQYPYLMILEIFPEKVEIGAAYVTKEDLGL